MVFVVLMYGMFWELIIYFYFLFPAVQCERCQCPYSTSNPIPLPCRSFTTVSSMWPISLSPTRCGPCGTTLLVRFVYPTQYASLCNTRAICVDFWHTANWCTPCGSVRLFTGPKTVVDCFIALAIFTLVFFLLVLNYITCICFRDILSRIRRGERQHELFSGTKRSIKCYTRLSNHVQKEPRLTLLQLVLGKT